MSILPENRILAFAELGLTISNNLAADCLDDNKYNNIFFKKIEEAENQNSWFVRSNIVKALEGISFMLDESKLRNWLKKYNLPCKNLDEAKNVAVIMAGNIPVVGFHDFMCVLLSGNIFLGKLSSQDKVLLQYIAEILVGIEPAFKPYIHFADARLDKFDAAIATGSNNSARYFDFYFGKYPHIIRKNRNSIAIITGLETSEELALLADDIFLYFGMGCRSVSKLLVPENYDFDPLFRAFEKWRKIADFHKYFNNYEYNKAIYLINRKMHMDNGFILLRESELLASPTAVLFFQYYKTWSDVENYIYSNINAIQCVVTSSKPTISSKFKVVDYGKAQKPDPDDYADQTDTLKFLLNL